MRKVMHRPAENLGKKRPFSVRLGEFSRGLSPAAGNETARCAKQVSEVKLDSFPARPNCHFLPARMTGGNNRQNGSDFHRADHPSLPLLHMSGHHGS